MAYFSPFAPQAQKQDGGAGTMTVKITVVRGTKLPKKDLLSSDPYVIVSIGPDSQRTKTVMKNLNPVFNETFTFNNVYPGTTAEFQVMDFDKKSKDDPMGNASVILNPQSGPQNCELLLSTKGSLTVTYTAELNQTQQKQTPQQQSQYPPQQTQGQYPPQQQYQQYPPQGQQQKYPQQPGQYPPQQYQQYPPQGQYPPQQGAYQQQTYPPQGQYNQPGYPPQQYGQQPQGAYPPQGYPPQQYQMQPGQSAPQQGAYPPQQPGQYQQQYPGAQQPQQQYGQYPQPGYPPQQYPPKK
ncbi:hypothetical protein EIN_184960 [Entamoeba invadens IP1]|uniref:hypothetical protein n=1 Tax=Entamoeba invadens IP1 TaxID=370355 RepID=UPI0002C3F333|nr:hypothetical protein EIN_184960 [Entamoeba invadens IP1]ELP94119.1 hypothetical protein EIN_184960 [Entamoeba invadens IP1]|eukprot:XP_004260890.1 hypothetical protein EIN_184960 [Entamoeba invadens IP1]